MNNGREDLADPSRADLEKASPPGDLEDRIHSLDADVGSGVIPTTFRVLIESIKDYAIFMLDPRGYVATWNAGAARIKGYASHEIIGRHFSTFYPPEVAAQGVCEMELEVAARDGRFEDEGWRLRKDGSHFWANVVITALRDETGALVGFAKVTRDLTERRKAEHDRLELARMQEASRLKDQFLATISHEIRTPLNAIFGWASLLKTAADDPATVEKAADTIVRNAEAQITIVDDMLDMSRIVTGKLRIEVSQVDFAQIVGDALEVVRPAAEAREISLESEGLDRPFALVGDAVRLQQIAWNFLSNAVKFSNRGGTVRVQLSRRDSAAELRVEDNGRGIARDFLPYVFEPFHQAEHGPARRVGGIGLGLAIVKHIVELHGGSVSATSDGPGQGAAFTASFPIRAVAPTQIGAARGQPAAAGPARSETGSRLEGVRVLAVDDDPDAREILQALFRTRGAVIRLAGSASEAREALSSFEPDIIISDIGMPGEDGYQLMQSVRALPKDKGGALPAIALTAYAYQEDRRRALAAGFNYHLAKPVNHEDLLRAVDNLIKVTGVRRPPM
ncbi:ATP-binding protein [Pendulispora brunnea]|uniref:histidine kinase n=1 Tax=Pendulispora brunnea TaxID=2905690 RepID=A0ABZ2K2D8_9BACT